MKERSVFMRYRDTDYLHASARAAYLQQHLITEDELLRAAGAGSAQEAYSILSAKQKYKNKDVKDYESSLNEELASAYRLVEEMTGQRGLTDIFRYPADGHNMKVMVKSRAAEGDFSELYKSGGTVDAAVMTDELNKGRFEKVPEVLGHAGIEAAERLAATGEPQIADVVIDKAVIRLISEAAAKTESSIIMEYAAAGTDLVNIRSALRLLRMNADVHTAAGVFSPEGSCTLSEFEEAYSGGYDALKKLAADIFGSERIAEAVELIKHGRPMGVFERKEDRYLMSIFKKAREIPFGIEPVLSFLYFKEHEIKACRVVLTSKLFDVPKEQIAERVRYIYAD